MSDYLRLESRDIGDIMSWRAVISITRSFEDRDDALDNLDAIIGKVPGSWEIRQEELKRE